MVKLWNDRYSIVSLDCCAIIQMGRKSLVSRLPSSIGSRLYRLKLRLPKKHKKYLFSSSLRDCLFDTIKLRGKISRLICWYNCTHSYFTILSSNNTPSRNLPSDLPGEHYKVICAGPWLIVKWSIRVQIHKYFIYYRRTRMG